jgi:hypothetical protein
MLAQEPELDDQQPQDTGQGNSAHASAPSPPSENESQSAPCARPVPYPDFDMIDFMHQSAAYDIQQVLQQAEDLPPIPPHVFSERSGGEARRVMLKNRTRTVTRSVSEVFAYSTSRTISAQDTAVILETFGNVSNLFMSCIVHLCYLYYLLYIEYILYLLFLLLLQPQFNPSDIPFRTMRTMSNRLIKELLPGEQIKHVDLHEGKIPLFFSMWLKLQSCVIFLPCRCRYGWRPASSFLLY